MTYKLPSVCVQQNILTAENKRYKIFVDEVETLWRENLGNLLSKDKASYKALVLTKPVTVVIPLTITRSPSWTLPNQVYYLKGSLMESITPKIDFTWTVEHTSATARELADLQISQNTLSKHYAILYWILTNNKRDSSHNRTTSKRCCRNFLTSVD
jgi:hypothetical protein